MVSVSISTQIQVASTKSSLILSCFSCPHQCNWKSCAMFFILSFICLVILSRTLVGHTSRTKVFSICKNLQENYFDFFEQRQSAIWIIVSHLKKSLRGKKKKGLIFFFTHLSMKQFNTDNFSKPQTTTVLFGPVDCLVENLTFILLWNNKHKNPKTTTRTR